MLNKFRRQLKSDLQLAGAQYDVPQWILRTSFFWPLPILFVQLLLTIPEFSEFKSLLWGENNLLENFQFFLFFLGGILSLGMAWQTKKQMEKRFVWIFYLLFSLGLFFIAMEEIAWGQQFLQFNTPEAIKAFNAQNEFTLHNVEILQGRSDLLNLIFGLGGLFGLRLSSQKKFQIISIPKILSSWFFLIAVLSALGVFIDFFSLSAQFDYTIHKQTETVELFIAIGSLLYLIHNFRAFTYTRPRWKQISALRIKASSLTIFLDDQLEISIPSERFPWLPKTRGSDGKLRKMDNASIGRTLRTNFV